MLSLHNKRTLADVLASCTFFPTRLDSERRQLEFVVTSRQVYEQSPFLVSRSMPAGGSHVVVNIDDLLLYAQDTQWKMGRTHYILISAFCCSTLLARYIGSLPQCFVLREPGVLGQLSLLRHRGGRGHPRSRQFSDEEWGAWAKLTLLLLSRVFEGDRVVLIKPADITNIMADTLLEHGSASRAVCVSIGLRAFILSVLKSDSRRAWARSRVEFWQFHMRRWRHFPEIRNAFLDDAKRAALLWEITHYLWRELATSAGLGRCGQLDGEMVATAPAEAITVVNRMLDLGVDRDAIGNAVLGDIATRHSKTARLPYDNLRRDADKAHWNQRFARVTDAAVAWHIELFGTPSASTDLAL